MKIGKQIILSASFLLFTLFGCSQNDDTKTTAPTPSATEDFDLDESALAASGYSKLFEENFTGDLSQWQVWEGGAFNEELQLYQKQNLIVANGILQIKSVKQNVTGPVLPDSDELSDFADQVLEKFKPQVLAYKKGKKGVLGLFVGEVMKMAKGKADPQKINALLEEKLK